MAKTKKNSRNYDLKSQLGKNVEAPKLNYFPKSPKKKHRIGLIGCGGISGVHLATYRAAGWDVVALCDINRDYMQQRQAKFYPQAFQYTDYHELLTRQDIDVVDIALHPDARAPVIEAAIHAGKHILSQKPLAVDLRVANRLVQLAEEKNVLFAVNQNGRWAPYVQWTKQAILKGLIGDVQSISIQLNWDHSWIRGTPFEKVRHIVLYDFAIHWFDMATWFLEGREVESVYALNSRPVGQEIAPDLMGLAVMKGRDFMASLSFDAFSKFGSRETLVVTGSKGTVRCEGKVCQAHRVTLFNEKGVAKPRLTGKWFNDGFRGTMAELLTSIEEGREPINSAKGNLASLRNCFAAVAAADTGKPQDPRKVVRLRD